MTPEGRVAAAIRRKLIQLKKDGHPIWFVKIAGGHRQRSGLPDTHITCAGRSVWIEAKRPGGKPTKHQEKTIQEIRDAGGVAECVDNAEDVEAIILNVLRDQLREDQAAVGTRGCRVVRQIPEPEVERLVREAEQRGYNKAVADSGTAGLITDIAAARMIREAEQRGRDAAADVFARGAMEVRNQILADAVREAEAAVAEAEQRGRDAEWEKFARRVAVMCKGFGSRKLVAVSEIVGLLDEVSSGGDS